MVNQLMKRRQKIAAELTIPPASNQDIGETRKDEAGEKCESGEGSEKENCMTKGDEQQIREDEREAEARQTQYFVRSERVQKVMRDVYIDLVSKVQCLCVLILRYSDIFIVAHLQGAETHSQVNCGFLRCNRGVLHESRYFAPIQEMFC